MTKAWSFIQTASGQVVLLIVCVVALVLVVTWPEFKQWLFKTVGHTPQPKPRPLHERVGLIETQRLPEIVQGVSDLSIRIEQVREWIGAAQTHNQNVLDQVSQLATKLDGSISWQERMKIPERFSDLSNDLHDLKTSARLAVDGLRKRAAKADKAIELTPSYFQRHGDIAELKSILGAIELDFTFILEVFPSSAPATLPFSNWRASIGATSDPGLLFAESVAKRLERYIEIAQANAIRWGRDFFTGDLFTLVGNWKQASVTDVSGEQLMNILQKHFSELRMIESDYAAIWSKTVESAAIS